MAATGFLLNLSNLFPIHPLDGGHVLCKITPRLVAFAPYAIAFLAPAYGDIQITALAVFLLMMGGIFTNKNLLLAFGAGVGVGALLWGPLWYLLITAGCAFMALVDVEHYIRLGWLPGRLLADQDSAALHAH